MKIVCIGDLHGSDCWRQIHPEAYDRIIFIGDYVDNKDLEDTKIVENLDRLIGLKKLHPDKVILLLGNHDLHYAEFPEFRSSGYNKKLQPDLTRLFKSNDSLFQIAFQVSNWLFTHAGISNDYLRFLRKMLPSLKITEGKIAEVLNELQRVPDKKKYLHVIGKYRGGNHDAGGITWADKSETESGHMVGIHQVVGHTRVSDIITIKNSSESSITYIDVLHSSIKFFEIDIR